MSMRSQIMNGTAKQEQPLHLGQTPIRAIPCPSLSVDWKQHHKTC